MTNKKKIFCLGNIAFDFINTMKSKETLSFNAAPGGSVFNTAIHLARLGLPVSMLTKTGTDFLGDTLIGVMKNENLSTKYAFQDKNIKTGIFK